MVTREVGNDESVIDDVHLVEAVVAVKSNSRSLDTVPSDGADPPEAGLLCLNELIQRSRNLTFGLVPQPADFSHLVADAGTQ